MKTRKLVMAVISVALAVNVLAVTNVFEMPLVFPRHRALRQRLVETVRAGRTEEMEKVCREAVELMPMDATWRYNLACALSYYADKEPAFQALERAIELGFRDVNAMQNDNDLKPLKGTPRFRTLMEKAKELGNNPVEGMTQAAPVTALMGRPVEVNAANAVFDFDSGCFKALLALRKIDNKKVSEYAAEYQGPAASDVRDWMLSDTVSGNFGDLYVNRDEGHSLLAVTNFPGLTPVIYGKDAVLHKAHRGLPNMFFDQPVLGNASLSMVSGPMWRSLPRMALTDPYQPLTMFRLYVNNQSWFFPAHKDYETGGVDHFPANTPYYVVSKGSSFSDRPFMEAFAATMAAFRPETKRMLNARKNMAPILQMILRATQKSLRKPDDYLTGSAHPAVFDAAELDAAAMVKMAYGLTPETIPPLVALMVLKDEQAAAGRDFFDLRPEGLFDTPFAIARVARGTACVRSMTLGASTAPEKQGAEFRWVVLQGDPSKIEIKALDTKASKVELRVAYHGVYRPTGADGLPSAVQSSRVDIGCFVKDGEYYSPPSIVSVCYLPNETRAYRDDGQILSVDYSNSERRYADPVLTMHKGWKDLYEYDESGRLIGWYRKHGDKAERFTHAGHRVLESDSHNRPVKACAVQYMPRQGVVEGLPPSLTYVDTPRVFTYVYQNDLDKVGKPSAAGR
ncbi:MAG: hypothetical protein PHU80_06975 [Kiritimatiellae bacterium]|nr:hypothetical protein [Kiritimatiellia bacterium]